MENLRPLASRINKYKGAKYEEDFDEFDGFDGFDEFENLENYKQEETK